MRDIILFILFIVLLYISPGLGMLYAGILVLFFYDYKNEEEMTKLDIIKPKLDADIKENNDLIEFAFSVQDFYVFNPEAYDEFIESLNSFIYLYDLIKIRSELANYNYQLAETERKNVLNSFHSLIYNLPPSAPHNNKFNLSLDVLESILNKYMIELKEICINHTLCNGLDVSIRPIKDPKLPQEYNTFDYDNFTYEIF